MTLRHIVFFTFPDGRDAVYLARLSAALGELVAAVPDIEQASWGEDVSANAKNGDFALVMDFADREAYARYRSHPAHLRFIETWMREVPMQKIRVQYELADKGSVGRPQR